MKSKKVLSSPGIKHPSAELLERYAMGKIPDGEVDTVEGHLLFCDRCRGELVDLDNWIRSVRLALSTYSCETQALLALRAEVRPITR